MRRQNETLRSLCRGPFGRLLHAMLRDPRAARLARRPGEHQGPPQREPRPRADGALHAGDRPLFRGRRQAGRPRPDGLEARGRRGAVRPRPARPGQEDDPRPHRRVRRGRPGRRCSSIIPRRPAGWPGGSATSSSARGPPTTARSTRWPRDCGPTTSTSAGASRRCSARGCSSTRANLGNRVSSPIEFAVGAVRALEMFDPSPSTPVLADWCGRLGQDLFYPPNVGGWPGGRAWITTRSAIGRANLAAALVGGESVGLSTPFDPIALAARHGQGRRPGVLRAVAARCRMAPRSRSMRPSRPGRPWSGCWLRPRRSGFDPISQEVRP